MNRRTLAAALLLIAGTVALAGPANATTKGRSSTADWERIPTVVGGYLSCAPSSTFCLVLTRYGSRVSEVTTDGTNWTSATAPAGTSSGQVSCPAVSSCSAIAYTGSHQAMLASTPNAGGSWTESQPWATTFLPAELDCPSTSVCYAVDDLHGIATNAGGSWKTTTMPGPVQSISCASTTVCIAVGPTRNGAADYFTVNGGTTWSPGSRVGLGTITDVNSVSCTTTSDCWATAAGPSQTGLGDSRYVVSTTDGGAHWVVDWTNSLQWESIDCVGGNPAKASCWVGNTGDFTPSVAVSTNGGKSFTGQRILELQGYLAEFDCVTSTTCWESDGVTVWHTTDGGGAQPDATTTSLAAPNAPVTGQGFEARAEVFPWSASFQDYTSLSVDFLLDGKPYPGCDPVIVASPTSGNVTCPMTAPMANGNHLLEAVFLGDLPLQESSSLVEIVAVHPPGYRLLAEDGGIFNFGGARYYGSLPGDGIKTESAVQIITDSSTGGYGIVQRDLSLTRFDTPFFNGSPEPTCSGVGGAATADGGGYVLADSCGDLFQYGDASLLTLGGADPSLTNIFSSSRGDFWTVDPDGDAFDLSTGRTGNYAIPGVSDVVGMTFDAAGTGYWLVGADGGVFTFGSAKYYGSMGGQHLNKPIVGIAADPATGGYWLVASDGGIFSFHAPYLGGTGGIYLNQPIVGMAVG